jgi:hypothetical protein
MLTNLAIAPASRVGTSYDATVLADSPLSFWKCNESSGTTLADSGTGGNPLTLSGTYTLGQTGIGDGEASVNFAGGSASVTPAQTLSGSYSIEFWATTTSLAQSGSPAPYTSRGPSGNSLDIQFGNSTTTIHADIGDGSNWLSTAANMSGLSLATSTWYHVVYVATSTGFTAYLNGAQKVTGSWAAATPLAWGTNWHPTIGGDSQAFSGNVAKVAGYGYALTAAQVLNHYNAQNSSGGSVRSPGAPPPAFQAVSRAACW